MYVPSTQLRCFHIKYIPSPHRIPIMVRSRQLPLVATITVTVTSLFLLFWRPSALTVTSVKINPGLLELKYEDSSETHIPCTTIPDGAHSYGFTIFDNLYLRSGTFYVVTAADPSEFPSRNALIAAPLEKGSNFDQEADDTVRLILSLTLQFINAHPPAPPIHRS